MDEVFLHMATAETIECMDRHPRFDLFFVGMRKQVDVMAWDAVKLRTVKVIHLAVADLNLSCLSVSSSSLLVSYQASSRVTSVSLVKPQFSFDEREQVANDLSRQLSEYSLTEKHFGTSFDWICASQDGHKIFLKDANDTLVYMDRPTIGSSF